MRARGSVVTPLLLVSLTPFLFLNVRLDGQEKPAGKGSPLKLTVTVLSQTYCVNRTIVDAPARGAVVGEVSFDLHLRIQNVGDHAIILCRKCIECYCPDLFDIQADGTQGGLGWGVIPGTFGVTVRAHHPKHPDSNDPIIPHEGALEMDRLAVVDFVDFSRAHTPSKGWVYPGRYFLQARFFTWDPADPDAEALARRWKSYGELYDQEIVAEPIAIQIEIPQAPVNCSAH
jgi:hypothetical protein